MEINNRQEIVKANIAEATQDDEIAISGLNVTAKKLANKNDGRWLVKKDGGMFDQFTGATITPRAVVKAVRNTVIYFNEHQDKLFESASNCQNNDLVKDTL